METLSSAHHKCRLPYNILGLAGASQIKEGGLASRDWIFDEINVYLFDTKEFIRPCDRCECCSSFLDVGLGPGAARTCCAVRCCSVVKQSLLILCLFFFFFSCNLR
ncbi:hypothetical protein PVAP13_6KG193306 [Panicum virgatum]|uniref:Uncharacterized protein n=1 Tax=Panicum virgatum TaxID=38727 RepID=A0A8T0RFT7_PANVG|nr:hypothetical protein PVAP13_6KG193306 [Panicum virgatum]